MKLFFGILVGMCCAIVYFLLIPENKTYILYRNSETDKNMRIHISSFNSNESDLYNRDNCEIARDLFQSQPGVRVKYWCEKANNKFQTD